MWERVLFIGWSEATAVLFGKQLRAFDAYRAETNDAWRPRCGSHVSQTGRLTSAAIDTRDFWRARRDWAMRAPRRAAPWSPSPVARTWRPRRHLPTPRQGPREAQRQSDQ